MNETRKPLRISSLSRDAKQNAFIAVAFVGVMLIFTIGSKYFLTPKNILSIFVAAVPLGLIAIGECFCVMTGSLDLSVGNVASIAGVAAAMLIQDALWPVWAAMLAAFLIGPLSGALAGLAITRLKVPAWIATYSLLQIWRGVIMILTEGNAIRMSSDAGFKWLGQFEVIGKIELPVVLMILIYIAAAFMLRKTRFGRSFFAVGGNIEAAKNCGMRIKTTQFSAFVISGAMASLAGLLFASRSAAAQPLMGQLYALQGIAATVIGGTAMAGGKANMATTFLGLLIIMAIQNGLNMLGVPSPFQYIATGVMLFIAVLIQTERPR